MDLTYRLVNVFAESRDTFSGNPVCVIEEGSALDDDQMRSIAKQFNTDTVFLHSASRHGAEICCYAFDGEQRFAASAALAAAHVVNDLNGNPRSALVLHVETDAGRDTLVSPTGGDNWQITARPAEARKLNSSPQILASLVGLPLESLNDDVMVVDSGHSGIILPVATPADVQRARMDARMLHSYAMLLNTEPQVQVWALEDDRTIHSRMFYGPGGGVVEVAATGSGAGDLGHWLASHGQTGAFHVVQGFGVGRPSVVELEVTPDHTVRVGGHVNGVAKGVMTLSDSAGHLAGQLIDEDALREAE